MSDATRKLATIVALDVAGYSARTEADEATTVAQVALLRPVIEGIAKTHGGRVFNTAGDGFMLEFSSALSGVNAALELADECRPRVRVGVHVGEVAVQPNGDLLGHGVNVAARLMAKAEPGSALISGDVCRMIRGPLAERFVSRGPVQLDKMNETIEIFAPAGPAHPATKPAPPKAASANAFQWTWPTPRVAAMAGAPVLLIAVALLLWSRSGGTSSSAPDDATPAASVAVLPFENLSTDKANEFFATGIQDEILTRLTKIGSLKVISRTSTAHLSSRPENLSEIAKQLGVANILEGSVQRQGDAVRVNVQLIKASTDSHLWAEVYDRKLDDIFAVQSEIAIAVAEALSAKVTGEEKQELAAIPTKNTAAYDAYLRGLAFWDKSDPPTAAPLFQKAVDLDPQFAGGWAQLAQAHAALYHQFDRAPAQREAARKALDAALRLQPDAADVAMAQAYYQYWVERDFEGARRRFEQIHTRWPNNAGAASAIAFIARRQGRWDQAIDYLKRALELDPRSANVHGELLQTYAFTGDYDRARQSADAALNIWPDENTFIGLKATILQAQGQWDQAAALLKGARPKTVFDDVVGAAFYQAYCTRRTAEAIAQFQSLHASIEAAGAPAQELAFLNVLLGALKNISGDLSGAKANFDAAANVLIPRMKTQVAESPEQTNLAMLYSYRGEHEQALRMVDAAIARLPVTSDAIDGAAWEELRARFLARAGDKDRAIPAIVRMLKTPGPGQPITPATLRLDPDFDKLRGDPRFEALLK